MKEKRIEEKQKYGICDVIMRLSEKEFCVVAGMVALTVVTVSFFIIGIMIGSLANR